jgi:iron complex transport system ATP-binding protein
MMSSAAAPDGADIPAQRGRLQLELRNVTAGYRDRVVLHDITCRIEAGALVGLIGPNGAGKTTLLRVISGYLQPQRGQVLLDNRDIREMPPRERSRYMALVPQTLHIPVPFSVAELAAIGRTPYLSGWSPLTARDKDAVRAALSATDLSGLQDRPVDELSAGERQLALVAMALAQETRVLLLDEPAAHLDIHHAWSLIELVRSLAYERNMAVVMTSHDLNLAGAFCTKLVLLEQGRVAAEGSRDEVLTEPILSRVYGQDMEIVQHGEIRLVHPRQVKKHDIQR